jgi:NADPH-dependent 2,4-dienoyl-CoA reductase/sulfur reductase-like enzyme
VLDKDGRESRLPYDELVIGTGATPVRLPIGGLDTLGPDHGVFLLHTMDDTFELTEFIDAHRPTAALIVGAGYLRTGDGRSTHRPWAAGHPGRDAA